MSTSPTLHLELRAAMGGTDAARFASQLATAYQRLAQRRGWYCEQLESLPGPEGGTRLTVLRLAGAGIEALRAEIGTHRVQRVPANDRSGRRHSSAVTVALLDAALPAAHQPNLNPADLRFESFRSSGPGGQNVNKRSTAVRVTHLPTGTVVSCQEGRSFHANKAAALQRLSSRLEEAAASSSRSKTDRQRAVMVGSGNIAEHVRTYAFQRGTATDHRNKQSAPLPRVLNGELELLWITP